jgi:hypothetical protein
LIMWYKLVLLLERESTRAERAPVQLWNRGSTRLYSTGCSGRAPKQREHPRTPSTITSPQWRRRGGVPSRQRHVYQQGWEMGQVKHESAGPVPLSYIHIHIIWFDLKYERGDTYHFHVQCYMHAEIYWVLSVKIWNVFIATRDGESHILIMPLPRCFSLHSVWFVSYLQCWRHRFLRDWGWMLFWLPQTWMKVDRLRNEYHTPIIGLDNGMLG